MQSQSSPAPTAPPPARSLRGRDRELTFLQDLVAGVVQGRGGAAAVIGQPGVGKTALLQALSGAAPGVRTVWVSGTEAEIALPFAGLHQVLQQVRADLVSLPALQQQALAVAMGEQDGPVPEPVVVALAFLGALTAASNREPLLCLVDDLQWFDPASRTVLLFAARRIHSEPIGMVLAVSADDWPSLRQRGLPTCEIGDLDAADAMAVLVDRASGSLAMDVAQRLVDATGGNPLALTEVAARLNPQQLAGRQPLPVPLPIGADVVEAFASTLDELSPGAQRILLAIAADGREIGAIERLAAHLSVESLDLELALASPLVVMRDSGVRFKHPLARTAVYGHASAGDRHVVHLALADLAKGEDHDRYAWHLAAASPGPSAEAADALAAAGKRATARGALAEAATAFARAADLSPDRHQQTSLLYESAHAAWRVGRPVAARDSLEKARRLLPDDSPMVEVDALRGVIELSLGEPRRAYQTLVRAARECRLENPDRAVELLALASEAASLALDYPGEIELGRMVSGWEVGSSAKLQALREALVGFAAQSAGDLEGGVARLRDALDHAEGLDDPDLLLTLGRAAIQAGDDERSYRLHLSFIAGAQERGSLANVPLAGARLALAEICAGNLGAAEATAAEAVRLATETGQADVAPHARVWLGMVRALRGDRRAAEEHLREALSAPSGAGSAMVEDAAQWVRGVIALGDGKAGDAVALLESISHPVIQTFSALDFFEASAATERQHYQDRLISWERFAESSAAPCALARLSHARGLLGATPDESESHLVTALAYHEASRRPVEQARTELALGAMLRRNRQRARARAHLRSAYQAFARAGLPQWSARADHELRATGETVRHGVEARSDQLTPQERQVAMGVADGLSNRDVAARLVISPRTVEFHLRNVFGKLGVASRTELAKIVSSDLAFKV